MGRDTHVFLNMPFESKGLYRNLLIAYVAGLSGLGFTARSVLEVPQHLYRLDRLREIVSQCSSSIHDLSCLKRTNGCPRFNMPFELGLVVARPSARWFVFEAEPHRLQQSLSDVNGHDPLVHRGNPEVALVKLRDVFRNRGRHTSADELRELHVAARKLARFIERDQGSLIGRQAFEDLVVGAQKIAARRGLI
jgi:hypothetical protein